MIVVVVVVAAAAAVVVVVLDDTVRTMTWTVCHMVSILE